VTKEVMGTAETLRSEYVIEVTGKVEARTQANDKLATGTVELHVETLTILNTAKTTPFEIKDGIEANDDTRLRYRYLDLRRPEMLANLKLRAKVTHSIRNYLDELEFIDVETPFLTKSTPEGARDYLVPSRVNQGHFYALPQSPQITKQLLMNAGFDRYYQIVKCFRDEDLRGDRQPEFTQVDLETSFLSDQEIQDKTNEFKQRIQDGASLDSLLPEAFAVVKQACKRLVGTTCKVKGQELTWNMVPYDVQFIGGIILHQGKIAEMKTGEGKTLVAVAPVYLNALSGKGVQVVTVNDYLASRDAEWMAHVYNWLGLSV